MISEKRIFFICPTKSALHPMTRHHVQVVRSGLVPLFKRILPTCLHPTPYRDKAQCCSLAISHMGTMKLVEWNDVQVDLVEQVPDQRYASFD